MNKLLNVTINGKKIAIPAATTVLTAAKSLGIVVPTLCHNPRFSEVPQVANCRICVVKRESDGKFYSACKTIIEKDGESYVTGAPDLEQYRLLASFISQVNLRSGPGVAELFEENGMWKTNDPKFGTLTGRKDIQNFVDNVLPKKGPIHNMVDEGMKVQVFGKTFEFKITKGPQGLIGSIERLVQ